MDMSNILPTVPIPQTDVSGFSYTDDAFDFIYALDEAAAEQKGSYPYIELRSLVVAFAGCGYDSYHKHFASYTQAQQILLSVEASQGFLLFWRSLPCTSGCPTPGNYQRKLHKGCTKETIHDLLRLFFQIKLMTLWRPSIFQCLLPLQRITDSARCNPTSMDSIRYVVCPLNSGLC